MGNLHHTRRNCHADTSSVSSLSLPIIDVFAGSSETYASLFLAQDVLSYTTYNIPWQQKTEWKKQKICCKISKLARRGNTEVDDQGNNMAPAIPRDGYLTYEAATWKRFQFLFMYGSTLQSNDAPSPSRNFNDLEGSNHQEREWRHCWTNRQTGRQKDRQIFLHCVPFFNINETRTIRTILQDR